MSEIDISDIKTIPLSRRKSKVTVEDFLPPLKDEDYSADPADIMPRRFAGGVFREIVSAIVNARQRGRPVILAMGAHAVKCGLSRIIIQLMERGLITALAVNGAVAVHDFEIFFCGKTSEDVADSLDKKVFGMAEETGKHINEAVNQGTAEGLGFGRSLGKWMAGRESDFSPYSLFHFAFQKNIPLTVHVAVGTDIIHQHPSTDGSAIGETSYRDFKCLAGSTADAVDGGVWINLGSAVILPEVFLKTYSIALNLGRKPRNFTTVNMDMIMHYRPGENVVGRPDSRGLTLIGHHEINLPLLAASLLKNYDR